jgi:hypothetical protein
LALLTMICLASDIPFPEYMYTHIDIISRIDSGEDRNEC